MKNSKKTNINTIIIAEKTASFLMRRYFLRTVATIMAAILVISFPFKTLAEENSSGADINQITLTELVNEILPSEDNNVNYTENPDPENPDIVDGSDITNPGDEDENFTSPQFFTIGMAEEIKALTITTESFQFQVTVTENDLSFVIPTCGSSGSVIGGAANTYDWDIDWGDGNIASGESGTGDISGSSSNGILHSYDTAGTYTITITPAGSTDRWLAAFGFTITDSPGIANTATNKNKVTKVLSPLTPLMTRSQSQITDNTALHHEWAYTFSGCTNLTMGEDFMFSGEWNNIIAVGNGFARNMFTRCSGADFTMNDVFNLPTGIETVGNHFAFSMFGHCNGAAFNMNDIFNLPTGIETVGDSFAEAIFSSCSGNAFKMNDIFNLPTGIKTIGNRFAAQMFYTCRGAAFNMNDVFNLPTGIISVGNNFADGMFYSCSGDAFNMNAVFNLPTGIKTVGDDFAAYMFFNCSGNLFNMNAVFNLPTSINAVGNNFADSLFSSCAGPAFTMNAVFNLPTGIISVGNNFAANIFYACFNAAFKMNTIFNLPSDIKTVGTRFAEAMFFNCFGSNFAVNEVFIFPKLNNGEVNKTAVFERTFFNVVNSQARAAADIINGNEIPPVARMTFAAGFSDRPYIPINWGGNGFTPVTAATIAITAPATAAIPVTADPSGGTGYTCSTVSWSPALSPTGLFTGSTAYTASITLTTAQNYSFLGIPVGVNDNMTINGNPATILNNTGNTMTLSYTFPATIAAEITGISVGNQPAKTSYIHGEALNLSGLTAIFTYNDGTSRTIPFNNFGINNITASPASGTTLSRSTHDGEPVTLIFDGTMRADTTSLSVAAATLSGTPTISIGGDGILKIGQSLTAVASSLNATPDISYGNTSYSFTWRAGNTVVGADSSNYTATSDDVGQSITVTVTAIGNYAGSVTSTATAAVPYTIVVAEEGTDEPDKDYVAQQTLYGLVDDDLGIAYRITRTHDSNQIRFLAGNQIVASAYVYGINAAPENGTLRYPVSAEHDALDGMIDGKINLRVLFGHANSFITVTPDPDNEELKFGKGGTLRYDVVLYNFSPNPSLDWKWTGNTPPPDFDSSSLDGIGLNHRLVLNFEPMTVIGEYSFYLYSGSVESAAIPVVIHPDSITEANISVTAPEVGGVPSSDAYGASNFTINNVTWTPMSPTGKFIGETRYTATVTLMADYGYTFAGLTAGTNVTINGYNAVISNNTDDEVTLSYEFPATGTASVAGISVKEQPTKTTYIYGDLLDLNGLVARLTYNDGTVADISFSDFNTNKITASPADGTLLSHTAHDGNPVILIYDNDVAITANTTDLSVARKELTIDTVAHTKEFDGTVTAVDVALTFDGFTGMDDNSSVTAASVTAAYVGMNAGTKDITISAVTLQGINAGNYSITLPGTPLTVGGITKKNISIDTVATLAKVYDGTNTATAGTVTFSGEVPDYRLSASDYDVTAAFADADAGYGKEYTYTVTLKNTEMGNNYSLAINAVTRTDGIISPINLDGMPVIQIGGDGNLKAGQTLTVDVSLLNATPDISSGTSYSYQWQAGSLAVGSDSNTYTVKANDIGETITVKVTAAGNYIGSVISDATAAIPYTIVVAEEGTDDPGSDYVASQVLYGIVDDDLGIAYRITRTHDNNQLQFKAGSQIVASAYAYGINAIPDNGTFDYTVSAVHDALDGTEDGIINLTALFVHADRSITIIPDPSNEALNYGQGGNFKYSVTGHNFNTFNPDIIWINGNEPDLADISWGGSGADRTLGLTVAETADVGEYRFVISADSVESAEITLVINLASITEANITVTAPEVGQVPSSDAYGASNFTINNVTWTPMIPTGKFIGETQYTATVMLTADYGYTFAGLTAGTNVTINGFNVVISNNTGDELMLSYEFAATGPASVAGISVKEQPTETKYIYSDLLDLNGLVARLTYNDGTAADISFSDFDTNKITASPADGSALSHTAHDGNPVTLIYDNDLAITANTTDLTVARKELTIDTVAHTKEFDGTVTAAGVALTFDGFAGMDDNSSITAASVTAAYAGMNAGTKDITISAVTLQGINAGNYSITLPGSPLTVAGITKKNISIDTVATLAKVYDGTNNATAGVVTFSGEVPDYRLSTSDYEVTAAFTDADAGTGKEYTYTVTLKNTETGNNYNLSPHTATRTDGIISSTQPPVPTPGKKPSPDSNPSAVPAPSVIPSSTPSAAPTPSEPPAPGQQTQGGMTMTSSPASNATPSQMPSTLGNDTGQVSAAGGNGEMTTPASGDVTNSGNIVVNIQKDETTPEIVLNTDEETLHALVLSPAEMARIANGEEARIFIIIEDIKETISDEDKELIAEKLRGGAGEAFANENADNYIVGFYLDITKFKQIGDDDAIQINYLGEKITLSIEVLEELRAGNREYKIIRIHDGIAEIIDGIYDSTTGLFTFETDRFSTYALIYADLNNTLNISLLENPADGRNYFLTIAIAISVSLAAVIFFFIIFRRKKEDEV